MRQHKIFLRRKKKESKISHFKGNQSPPRVTITIFLQSPLILLEEVCQHCAKTVEIPPFSTTILFRYKTQKSIFIGNYSVQEVNRSNQISGVFAASVGSPCCITFWLVVKQVRRLGHHFAKSKPLQSTEMEFKVDFHCSCVDYEVTFDQKAAQYFVIKFCKLWQNK